VTTLTPTRLAAMPRVNLLPPEIAEAARFKRLQIVLGLLVVGALAMVVLVFLMVSGQVGGAEDELSQAEARGQQLEAEVASFAEVPEVTNALTNAQQNLATAMTPEIRWSFLLNDLGLVMPQSSRLATLTATNTAAAAQIDPAFATGLTAPTTPMGTPSMGTIVFTGSALDFDAVATWLQTLNKQAGLVEPTVTAVNRSDAEDTRGNFYEFESNAQLSSEAASNRYLTIAGGE
jgi:Tfp pilus assembly protein PilN